MDSIEEEASQLILEMANEYYWSMAQNHLSPELKNEIEKQLTKGYKDD